MPNASKDIIGIVLADLHLTVTAPPARSGEKDWLGVQAKHLQRVKNLSDQFGCPVLCAGDVFDKWKVDPELISFAIDHLPEMWAIPGQHDLPFHSLDNIKKSAFWTMIKAGKIHPVPEEGILVGGKGLKYWMYGFPWGIPIHEPQNGMESGDFRVALVHEYTWYKKAKYTGAPEESRARRGKYKGYDVVAIGDNHIPFDIDFPEQKIFNCGGFLRRKSDETDHRPRVGLITRSGDVVSEYLDIEGESFVPVENDREIKTGKEFDAFLKELSNLQTVTLDYAQSLRRAMTAAKTPAGIRAVVEEALENGRRK